MPEKKLTAREASTPGTPYDGPTGSISGVVQFKGEAPERRELAELLPAELGRGGG